MQHPETRDEETDAFMNSHTLTLFGDASTDGRLRVSAGALTETLGLFLEGVRRTVRFEIEGESVRPGQRPGWLDELCDIDLTGLSSGSTVIALEAPAFGTMLTGDLWDEGRLPAEHTAVDRFAIALASMVEEGTADDEVMADRALLDVCARLARSVGSRFDGLRLEGLRGREASVIVKSSDVARIEALKEATPRSRAVRLSGRLDTISASRSDIVLALTDGTRLPARMDRHDPAALGHLFGEEVTVSGTIHYRPSGRAHHIRAEAIDRARQADRLFRTLPVHRATTVAERVPQDESSGVNAFFGRWPGDETEEELLESLRAIG